MARARAFSRALLPTRWPRSNPDGPFTGRPGGSCESPGFRRREPAAPASVTLLKERIYDALNKGLERRGFAERRDRLVASLAGEVLEIGAGTGLNLPRYRHASRVTVVEPDTTYARRLRQRAAAARVPVDVVIGKAEQLPFRDEAFDHAVASLALCSVDDLDAVLGEVRRVLRAEGSLVFLEHVRSESARRARWQDRLTPVQRRLADGCHLNRDTPTAIERAGFELVALERFELPPGHPLIKDAVQGVALKPA